MNENPNLETPVLEPPTNRARFAWIAGLTLLVLVAVIALWPRATKPTSSTRETRHEETHEDEGQEVVLPEDARTTAGIETVEVVSADGLEQVRITGSVETNQQRTQHVTPLVSGRIEKVHVVLGDRVRAGDTLVEMSSPEIAELHGKLHEAETRLTIAEHNHQQVQQPESRVSVLQARAKLNEAEATLKRTQKLIELGSAAGKDLTAAETAFQTAKAEFEFQSRISLNREVRELKAALETARAEVRRIRDGLGALGAPVPEDHGGEESNIGLVRLRAPLNGTVIERFVNNGAGVEAGKSLFTIADLSTVWVIANVPNSRISAVSVGATARIRTPSEPDAAVTGKITYLDPRVDEETRTAKVRIEVPNPNGRLRAGMFVEVGFSNRNGAQSKPIGPDTPPVVPDEALQRIGGRMVVFLPKPDEEGAFEVREVEVGEARDGKRVVTGGLKAGERVVTKGSFTLKTQLMKGELGEHDH